MFVEGEIGLYEEVFDAWKREKDSDAIQTLRAGFFKRASDYLSNLKRSITKADRESSSESVIKREIDYVEFMLSALLRMRARKIALLSLGDPSEISPHLQENEVTLSQSLHAELEEYTKECLTLQMGIEGAPESLPEKERTTSTIEEKTSSLLLLRILQPIPKLVGVDLDEYGPFQQEDLVLLPRENALVLIARGAASEVKIARIS